MSHIVIDQDVDFYCLTVDGIMFSADKCERVWHVGYEECSTPEMERVARSVGMTVDAFWAHYRPLLNNAVGWD